MKATIKITKADVPVLADLTNWVDLRDEASILRRAMALFGKLWCLRESLFTEDRGYGRQGSAKVQEDEPPTFEMRFRNIEWKMTNVAQMITLATSDRKASVNRSYNGGGDRHRELVNRANYVRMLDVMTPGGFESIFMGYARKEVLAIAQEYFQRPITMDEIKGLVIAEDIDLDSENQRGCC